MANRSFIQLFLMIIVVCFAPDLLCAQTQNTPVSQTQEQVGKLLDDDKVGETDYASILEEKKTSDLKLPPLSVLFENMKSTPRYKMALNEYKMSKSTLSSTRRAPLNWVSIGASYAYGQFGSQSQSTAETTPVTTSVANGVTTSYGMTASVGTTIGSIIDYRSTVKRAKLATENSKLTFLEEYQNQKLQVMELYNKIESLMNTLGSLAQSEILATADYEYAQQEFMAGSNNNPNTMSRAKERQNTAKMGFANAKTELNTYLVRLEILTHTQILEK